MSINEKVKEIRASLGLSQSQMADLLNLSTSGYCLKERGLRDFKFQELAVLAIKLNISPTVFFDIEINRLRNSGVRG